MGASSVSGSEEEEPVVVGAPSVSGPGYSCSEEEEAVVVGAPSVSGSEYSCSEEEEPVVVDGASFDEECSRKALRLCFPRPLGLFGDEPKVLPAIGGVQRGCWVFLADPKLGSDAGSSSRSSDGVVVTIGLDAKLLVSVLVDSRGPACLAVASSLRVEVRSMRMCFDFGVVKCSFEVDPVVFIRASELVPPVAATEGSVKLGSESTLGSACENTWLVGL